MKSKESSNNKEAERNTDMPSRNTDASTDELKKDVDKLISRSKKNPVTGQKQYPKNVGHHGTDDEQDLNPEE